MFLEHASAREKSQVEAFFFAMKTQRYKVSEPRVFVSLKAISEKRGDFLAELIGKSISLVSKVQYGLRSVSEEDAQTLSNQLGVPKEFLFEPIQRKKRSK